MMIQYDNNLTIQLRENISSPPGRQEISKNTVDATNSQQGNQDDDLAAQDDDSVNQSVGEHWLDDGGESGEVCF